MELYESLTNLLKTDERLVSSGKLLKNKALELGLKLDEKLIKLLLTDEKMKGHFFKTIDNILVFDKEKFAKFVDSHEFLPDSYTSFKNKIGLQTDGEYLVKSKEVVLVWPHKDCVLEGGQEEPDEKRREIFYNEILAPDEIDRLLSPKVFINFKRVDKEGEHNIVEINENDNLLIKGNNLLGLCSLQKKFKGRIKLIYIDPPYNREDENFYNDNFKHSTWLTFMKNRLEIAKQLLRSDDGIIFIQIDYRELAYLKVLMDELFLRENFIGQINWQRVPEGRTLLGQGESDLKISTEYLLIYANHKRAGLLNNDIKKWVEATDKIMAQYSYLLTINSMPEEFKRIQGDNGNDIIFYKVDDYELKHLTDKSIDNYISNYENIVQSVGVQEESTLQQKLISITKELNALCIVEYYPTRGKRKGERLKDYFIKDRKLLFVKDFSTLVEKKLYREGDINDFWTNEEIQVTDIAKEGGVSLRRGKKPEHLLQRIIAWATKENDIVLDYFMGTGTTCAVAHKMKRQYIGIEQLDYGGNSAMVRLKNVINGDQTGISKEVNWKGGGDFVYMELMKLNEHYVEKIRDSNNEEELQNIWEEIKLNGFLSYRVDLKLFDKNIEEFKNLSIDEQKKLLIETLDKNFLYVNFSEIDDEIYKIRNEDKELNKKFYGE